MENEKEAPMSASEHSRRRREATPWAVLIVPLLVLLTAWCLVKVGGD